MKDLRLKIFIGAVFAGGVTAVASQNWHSLRVLTTQSLFSLAVLMLLSLFAEALALNLDVGKKAGSTSVSTSITFVPLLVGLLLFGPTAACFLMLVAGVTAEVTIRKKPLPKILFNAGQWAIACTLAGIAYQLLGGRTLIETGVQARTMLIPFVAYAAVFVGATSIAVAGAISVSGSVPLKKTLAEVIGPTGGNLLYDILISPIGFGIALLYKPLNVSGLLLAFLPILFVRHGYFINLRLQQANKDLVRALVKAIETRDPYTSGHSLRVARLARSIAETLDLPSNQVSDIETAALLHDIGKIDIVYEDIIRKPTDLSPTERAVIESHVIKGVELLRTLSSFSEEVVASVRHHHEREDGRGYPDRLRGDEIPMGAKIIRICDAVDAMLSDRPYRKALSVMQVREQLTVHAGSQFDEMITQVVVSSDVLEKHAANIALRSSMESTESRPATSPIPTPLQIVS